MLRYTREHVGECRSGASCKKCPYWVVGRHHGKRYHQSLRTADSKTAAQLVQRLILTGRLDVEPEDKGVTIEDAVDQFFAEQEGRGAARSTLKSFRKFLTGAPGRAKCKNPERFSPTLVEFAAKEGVQYIRECDTGFTARFRQSWRVGKRTSEKQTERLRSFFTFAVARKWITDNPAKSLKPPIGSAKDIPVIPFTREQIKTVMDACGDNEYLKTFLLVMRYSGLATVDAIKLTPDRLEGDHLRLRRTKTKGWVKVLLPKAIADRLRALTVFPCGYWFWNKQAESTHETATGNIRRLLRPVFRAIPLKDEEGVPITDRNGNQRFGFPYQFRHTFVREQLEAGASLERIAELLGNTIGIVEKHYSGWVVSRQALLDAVVTKSWNTEELAGY
jgi:site-specific recombinase XerD